MRFRKYFRRFKVLAPIATIVAWLGMSVLPQAKAADTQSSSLKVNVGEKAPDFALKSTGGKTVKLSDFAGHNVLIDFYRGYW
jgi:hypothetical protein